MKKNKIKKRQVKVKCKTCNSVFIYTEDDLESDEDGNYVICPICKTYITSKI